MPVCQRLLIWGFSSMWSCFIGKDKPRSHQSCLFLTEKDMQDLSLVMIVGCVTQWLGHRTGHLETWEMPTILSLTICATLNKPLNRNGQLCSLETVFQENIGGHQWTKLFLKVSAHSVCLSLFILGMFQSGHAAVMPPGSCGLDAPFSSPGRPKRRDVIQSWSLAHGAWHTTEAFLNKKYFHFQFLIASFPHGIKPHI